MLTDWHKWMKNCRPSTSVLSSLSTINIMFLACSRCRRQFPNITSQLTTNLRAFFFSVFRLHSTFYRFAFVVLVGTVHRTLYYMCVSISFCLSVWRSEQRFVSFVTHTSTRPWHGKARHTHVRIDGNVFYARSTYTLIDFTVKCVLYDQTTMNLILIRITFDSKRSTHLTFKEFVHGFGFGIRYSLSINRNRLISILVSGQCGLSQDELLSFVVVIWRISPCLCEERWLADSYRFSRSDPTAIILWIWDCQRMTKQMRQTLVASALIVDSISAFIRMQSNCSNVLSTRLHENLFDSSLLST